jgi:hypothetical protein
MATEDAPRSGPPMEELPPNAERSQEIAAEQAAALPGPEERADHMAAELVDHGVSEEDAQRVTGGTPGNVVRDEHQETPDEGPPGRTARDVPCWETGLALSAGVRFIARGRVQGKLDDDESGRLTAPIQMSQVGWLDQKGRVWLECPPSTGFDGGSLTPLLIQLSYDD